MKGGTSALVGVRRGGVGGGDRGGVRPVVGGGGCNAAQVEITMFSGRKREVAGVVCVHSVHAAGPSLMRSL